MPIKFICYACNSVHSAKEGIEGRIVKCSKCGEKIIIPGAEYAGPAVVIREAAPRREKRQPRQYSCLGCIGGLTVIVGAVVVFLVVGFIGLVASRMKDIP